MKKEPLRIGSYVELEYSGRGFIKEILQYDYVVVSHVDGNISLTTRDCVKVIMY